jgi:hypothetical protein
MRTLWLLGMRERATSQNDTASSAQPTAAPSVPTLRRSQAKIGNSFSALTAANGMRTAICVGPASQMPTAASQVLLRYSHRRRYPLRNAWPKLPTCRSSICDIAPSPGKVAMLPRR